MSIAENFGRGNTKALFIKLEKKIQIRLVLQRCMCATPKYSAPLFLLIAKSAGAVECTDGTSAVG